MNEELKVTTSELVLSAVFFFQRKNGVTANDITEFICDKQNCEQQLLKDEVDRALKKATKKGIFIENKGLYKIRSEFGRNIIENLEEWDDWKTENTKPNEKDNDKDKLLGATDAFDDSNIIGLSDDNESDKSIKILRAENSAERDNSVQDQNTGKGEHGKSCRCNQNLDEDDEDFMDEDDEDDNNFFDDESRTNFQETDTFYTSSSKTSYKDTNKKRKPIKKKRIIKKKLKLSKGAKQRKKTSRQKPPGRSRGGKKIMKKVKFSSKEKKDGKENIISSTEDNEVKKNLENEMNQSDIIPARDSVKTLKDAELFEQRPKCCEKVNNKVQSQKNSSQVLKNTKNCQDFTEEIKKKNDEKQMNAKELDGKDKVKTSSLSVVKNPSGPNVKKFKRKHSPLISRPRKKKK